MWLTGAGGQLFAADAAGGGPPVELLWVGQAVTLGVALVTGWFALRTKRVDADETRRARFDARVDRELDEALAENKELRIKCLRYEGWLIRAGIDPETGRRFADETSP